MARRAWRTDLVIALAVALAAGALYFRTLAPGLLWGDSAEFQFAAWLGGFAHPTGYPLYLLMGWAWTHLLPWGDPAWRMNLLSAVWGAVAAGLTYVLATRVVVEVREGLNSGGGKARRAPTRNATLLGGEGSDRATASSTRATARVAPTDDQTAARVQPHRADTPNVGATTRAFVPTNYQNRRFKRLRTTPAGQKSRFGSPKCCPGRRFAAGLSGIEPVRRRQMRFEQLRGHLTRRQTELVGTDALAVARTGDDLWRREGSINDEGTARRAPTPDAALLNGDAWPARAAGAVAALTFAVTPTLWSQAVIAEVYTLHAAFVAAVLLAAVLLAAATARAPRVLVLSAALWGLGLAHHRSLLLLAPAVAVYLWWETRRGAQEPAPSRAVRLAPVILALVLPLLLYLYVPLRAPVAPYASLNLGPGTDLALYQADWLGFLRHVSGSVFAPSLGGGAGVWAGLAGVPARLAHEVTWPGIALGLLGAGWLWTRRRSLFLLTGLSFLAILAFNAIYAIGDIYVFYIPAYLIWCLWIGAGVTAAAAWAGARLRASWAVPALALLLPVFLVWSNFGLLDRSTDHTAREAWLPLLNAPLPQGSLLVSNDRDEIVPQWYLRYVEGMRPDVTGLFPLLAPGPEWSNVARVTQTALATGRPVYLAKPMPGLEVKFRLAELPGARGPLGPLVQVESLSGEPALVRSIDFGGKLRLAGYDLAPEPAGDALQVTLYWQALQPLGADYTTTVKLLDATGVVLAASDHQPGGVFYPSSLWPPGETLRDAHRLAGRAGRGQPPFELEVGVYLNRGAAGIESLGDAARIGPVDGP